MVVVNSFKLEICIPMLTKLISFVITEVTSWPTYKFHKNCHWTLLIIKVNNLATVLDIICVKCSKSAVS